MNKFYLWIHKNNVMAQFSGKVIDCTGFWFLTADLLFIKYMFSNDMTIGGAMNPCYKWM